MADLSRDFRDGCLGLKCNLCPCQCPTPRPWIEDLLCSGDTDFHSSHYWDTEQGNQYHCPGWPYDPEKPLPHVLLEAVATWWREHGDEACDCGEVYGGVDLCARHSRWIELLDPPS